MRLRHRGESSNRVLLAVSLLAVLAVSLGVSGPANAQASFTPLCSATSNGNGRCFSQLSSAAGIVNGVPQGYSPADLQSAYNLRVSKAGIGETVAITVVGHNPNLESDLAVYRSMYGLPPCTTANGCFREVGEDGSTNYPAPKVGWGVEESLDVDMVSAICPNCHILAVEASGSNLKDLTNAVNTAAALGADAISNSWGNSEFASEGGYDSAFDHPGTVITASSGDWGYGVSYPAAAPNVIAVGGTTLTRSSGARGWSETAWSGAGSGCSKYESKPAWQTDIACSNRTVADVAAIADPATGVAVYDSYAYHGWLIVGGTSVSSPIIASVYALADDGGTARDLYSARASLYDVISGSNGGGNKCIADYLCNAGPGYDGPTGNGTPHGTGAF